MPSRHFFPRLNRLFDIKHISIDLKKGGMPDEQEHQEGVKLNRLVVTFNGDDFKSLAPISQRTGIIAVSDNLSNEHIDKKLASLLIRSSEKAFLGKFIYITRET